MKGIILAGGSGTRLYPLTTVTSKQLLPVYDKPMIYYPLSTLMLAGIRDILIISTPKDIARYEDLFGNGDVFGINLQYAVQDMPNGLAEAFIIGENFIESDNCALILGDNIFYGSGLSLLLQKAVKNSDRATVFAHYVKNPEQFGVVELDKNGRAISIEEKPSSPKSHYAVTGLYFYNNKVVQYAKELKPSARGELEITDLNQIYLKQNALDVHLLGRGYAWMDAGSVGSLLEASSFIKILEEHQSIVIAALEEIAYNQGWIDRQTLILAAQKYGKSTYGQHLLNVSKGII